MSELDITGGDEKKIGYYAGLIVSTLRSQSRPRCEIDSLGGLQESIFYLTEVVFVIQWSRLSDHIGRKPVLLIGMAGATVSMLCFGLSRKFWQLVLRSAQHMHHNSRAGLVAYRMSRSSRCILGALNGNVGAMQSVVGGMMLRS